jgi:hypothetical protein
MGGGGDGDSVSLLQVLFGTTAVITLDALTFFLMEKCLVNLLYYLWDLDAYIHCVGTYRSWLICNSFVNQSLELCGTKCRLHISKYYYTWPSFLVFLVKFSPVTKSGFSKLCHIMYVVFVVHCATFAWCAFSNSRGFYSWRCCRCCGGNSFIPYWYNKNQTSGMFTCVTLLISLVSDAFMHDDMQFWRIELFKILKIFPLQ